MGQADIFVMDLHLGFQFGKRKLKVWGTRQPVFSDMWINVKTDTLIVLRQL